MLLSINAYYKLSAFKKQTGLKTGALEKVHMHSHPPELPFKKNNFFPLTHPLDYVLAAG